MRLSKLFKDVAWTSVFVIFGAFLGYGMRILFARNLSSSDYGLFYAIVSFFALFSLFRSLGMTESLVHFIPKYVAMQSWNKLRGLIRFVFSIQLPLSFIFSLLFFIFAKSIAVNFFHLESAAPLIRLQAITFFIIGVVEILVSIFRGFQNPIFASLYDPIRLFIMVAASVMFLKLKIFHIDNLFLAWLLSYLVLAVLYFIQLYLKYKKIFSFSIKKEKSVVKDIMSYSIPLMLGVGVQIIFARIDELILLFFKGTEQVALYEIAYPASQLMMILVSPFLFILLPSISKLYFEKNKEGIRNILQMIYNAGLFFAAPLALLLFFYPEIIIKLLFSSKYLVASTALQVMTFGTFFLMFSNINLNVLSGMGKIATRTKILYVIGIFNIVFNLILVPKFGYMGAVFATSSAFFLLWFSSYAAFSKEVPGFKLSKSHLLRILFCSFVFMFLVVFLKKILILNMYFEAALIMFVSFTVYFSLGIFVFKIINIKAIKEMIGEIRK
ncbi:TPA: flippase [Candidatus Woesearchaeota archaeon]|nr:flippase [Candidatus Woesearchaeota archaeon]HIH39518.1 flippase [Candidatus Woesearchaeota archaeon]